jgi:peptidoglycan/LPS O-acetylase OafA/YrhL
MGTHTQKPSTIAALAGARAIPPVLIVLYHYCEGHHYTGVRLIDLVATRGYLWVEFFFALSGFILTHVYAARAKELWTRAGYFGFLKSRLIRLYPLHLFMLLALLVLLVSVRAAADYGGYVSIYDRPSYHPNMTVEGFFASLFLVHGWQTLSTLTWNGASWFVSVEFALCLLFPFFLWFQKGRAWRGVALVAAGAAGLYLLATTSGHGLDLTFNKGIFRGAANFAIGVGLARLFAEFRHAGIPVWVHSTLQLLLVAQLLFIFTNTGWSHTPRDLLTAFAMQALIPALAFDKGVVADFLKFEWAQTVGEWSYGIYIGQTFWLQYMRVIEFRFYPPADTPVFGIPFADILWWAEPIALMIVCTLWGGLLATKIELPAAKWLRRQLDRPRPAAPTSGIT